MRPLQAAVIGVGHLGSCHAAKYAALPGVELETVVDIDVARARRVATRHGCGYLTDYRKLDETIDVVSIAVPTTLHYEVARHFIERGVHVLLEKPMTTTLEQADELVELVARRRVCFQVGHVERFNTAVLAMERRVTAPLFIESNRLAPFSPRGADVSVVLDLMIHDIDIILNVVREPVASVDAHGLPVVSDDIDIANVRLKFAGGCVANVTASRVSLKRERKMRLFQPDMYMALDLLESRLEIRRVDHDGQYVEYPNIVSETIDLEDEDPILNEIAAFLTSVRTGRAPLISARDGRWALATAIDIMHQLRADRPPVRWRMVDGNSR